MAEIQEAEYLGKDRKKLVVDQFTIPTKTIDEYDQATEDWHQLHKEEIKGKIRHGLVCVARRELGFKGPLSQMHKQFIKSDVDFIMTGE